MDHKELSQKIGNEAQRFVIEKFNWDVVAKRFVNVVESYLRENPTEKVEKNS